MTRSPSGQSRRWPYILIGVLVIVFLWIGSLGYRAREATRVADGPTLHDQIKALPDAQRFAKLRDVITKTSLCDRIVRADPYEPKIGGAIWSVSCYDGHQYAVLVNQDARVKPTAFTCDQLARASPDACWSR